MINPTIFFSFNFWQVGRCGICLTFYKRLCPMKMLTDEWHVTSNDGMKFLQLTTEHRRFLISKTIDLKSELRKFLRWIWNWSAQEVQRVIIGMPMRNPRAIGRNCKRSDCGRRCWHRSPIRQQKKNSLSTHTSNAIHKWQLLFAADHSRKRRAFAVARR